MKRLPIFLTRQDCPNAGLVRATDGKTSISWETPLITLNPEVKEVQLFLIAGMSLAGYVPGRTMQMPQILAKNNIGYMIINRQDKGLFNWLSPDGSKVLTYSFGYYYNDYVNL